MKSSVVLSFFHDLHLSSTVADAIRLMQAQQPIMADPQDPPDWFDGPLDDLTFNFGGLIYPQGQPSTEGESDSPYTYSSASPEPTPNPPAEAMATPGARPERAYHQDYMCRVRYENALPPPSIPPKFLDIPIDGLDYYASPAFASRLHRSQPINIEADAELGMPIDLVGMPGVFDGDESCECTHEWQKRNDNINF